MDLGGFRGGVGLSTEILFIFKKIGRVSKLIYFQDEEFSQDS
jgi:hypothetical protein